MQGSEAGVGKRVIKPPDLRQTEAKLPEPLLLLAAFFVAIFGDWSYRLAIHSPARCFSTANHVIC